MFAPIPGFVHRRGAHWAVSTLPKHPPTQLLSPWGDPDVQLAPGEEGGRRQTLMSPASQQHAGSNHLPSLLGALSWPSSASVAPTISYLCSGGWKENAPIKICLSCKCKPQGSDCREHASIYIFSSQLLSVCPVDKHSQGACGSQELARSVMWPHPCHFDNHVAFFAGTSRNLLADHLLLNHKDQQPFL